MGLLPKHILLILLGEHRVVLNDSLGAFLKYLNIMDHNDMIKYKECINLINLKEPFPLLGKIEGKHFQENWFLKVIFNICRFSFGTFILRDNI